MIPTRAPLNISHGGTPAGSCGGRREVITESISDIGPTEGRFNGPTEPSTHSAGRGCC